MPENTMTNIYHEFVFQAPINKVWSAVATSEGLEEWLMSNTFTPVLDSEFTFQTTPAGDWSGVVFCSVMEIDEPNRLVISWNGNNINTTVMFELEEKGGKTILHLAHIGWDQLSQHLLPVRNMLDEGWARHSAQGIERFLKQAQTRP